MKTGFTSYGYVLARSEEAFYTEATGAMRHMEACHYSTGLSIVLTGRDVYGKRFTKTASSVLGAHAVAMACSGIRRAWHVTDTGRKLIFTV